jgi:hypothetical protein
MSAVRRPESNKTLWIVLSIAGGLVVICGCCGVVVAVLYYRHQEKFTASEHVADQFLNDLSMGRIDSAYDLTSAAYKGRKTKQELRTFLDKNPALRTYNSDSLTPDTEASTDASLAFHAPLTGSVSSCTVRMVKEGDQWKVDDLTLP